MAAAPLLLERRYHVHDFSHILSQSSTPLKSHAVSYRHSKDLLSPSPQTRQKNNNGIQKSGSSSSSACHGAWQRLQGLLGVHSAEAIDHL